MFMFNYLFILGQPPRSLQQGVHHHLQGDPDHRQAPPARGAGQALSVGRGLRLSPSTPAQSHLLVNDFEV